MVGVALDVRVATLGVHSTAGPSHVPEQELEHGARAEHLARAHGDVDVEVAANAAFTIVFDNQDATAPHNVVLTNPDGSAVAMGGDTNFFTGPAKHSYQIGPLAAGSYPFHCQVHPQAMTGTLTVK